MSTGKLRRDQIIQMIRNSEEPISASTLATRFAVSRQVIVQDIALLRAADYQIESTIRGYRMDRPTSCRRVFKVRHSEDHTSKELQTIIDGGGTVVEVFVNHRVYGVIRTPMQIRSRRDIDHLVHEISSGNSSLLMHMTSGYHFHTVEAATEEILDGIAARLEQHGFLAPVLDYERHLLGDDPDQTR